MDTLFRAVSFRANRAAGEGGGLFNKQGTVTVEGRFRLTVGGIEIFVAQQLAFCEAEKINVGQPLSSLGVGGKGQRFAVAAEGGHPLVVALRVDGIEKDRLLARQVVHKKVPALRRVGPVPGGE